MEKHHKKKRFPLGWVILIILVSAAAVLGGAYWLGSSLAGQVRRMVTEPNELYYPIEFAAQRGMGAAAPYTLRPADTDTAGGVEWPALGEERRAALSGTKQGWGQGVEVNDKNQPTGALAGQEKYGGLGGYFIMPDTDNTVYFTFDLGYENGYTAPVLDALKEKGVKGVFFVTMDYVRDAPELVQRIISEGHVLGNHSVHHPSMPELSAEDARAEIMELHEYVKEHFGYEMTLFRFPRGEFSEKTMVLARDLGYASAFWSYAYVDWKTDAQPDVAASLQKLTKAAHPGAIYLLHTVSSTNAALMGDLIDSLAAEGYTVGLLPH